MAQISAVVVAPLPWMEFPPYIGSKLLQAPLLFFEPTLLTSLLISSSAMPNILESEVLVQQGALLNLFA
jgi:hypothetical protein